MSEPRSEHERLVSEGWLVRLRWVVALGTGLWAVSPLFGFGAEKHLWGLALWGPGVLSNVALHLRWRSDRETPESWLTGVLVLDTLLLTGLLVLTGGVASPYSFLFAIPLILSALVLRPAGAWAVLALTLTEYAGLFFVPSDNPHAAHMADHIWGMFAAFAVTAPLMVFAVIRIREARALADAELARARALRAQTERLTSLGTLAAGAAHELASPLSTVLLVSREMQRRAEHERDLEDLDCIREEVLRCKAILRQLSADAGAGMGEARERLTLDELMDGFDDVRWEAPRDLELELPRSLVRQAIRRLLGNARDASEADEPVALTLRLADQELEIEVADQGRGMSPEVLAKAPEPFFTTKPEGEGSGLGLFFTQRVVESLDGRLALRSTPGRGTVATIRLPLETAS